MFNLKFKIMKTVEIAKHIENLPESEKNAILAIIDLKVENDMDKVMSKLDSMNTRITTLYWLIGLLGLLMSVLKFVG